MVVNQIFLFVGMTGFEPATTRPPDAYSNRAELHPAHLRVQIYNKFVNIQLSELYILHNTIKKRNNNIAVDTTNISSRQRETYVEGLSKNH